jgi:hypothetical protein
MIYDLFCAKPNGIFLEFVYENENLIKKLFASTLSSDHPWRSHKFKK